MNRHLGRLVGMTLIFASTSASPAVAAGELGLSLDGTHWSSSITTPLFDPSFRWVPGDLESGAFFVRNQGGSTGDLTVDILGATVDGLIESGDLRVTAKGGGGDWSTISAGGTHRLLTAPNITEGSASKIKVNVAFDPASSNPTQLLASELTFRVALSESAPRGDLDDAGTGLPDTGAPNVLFFAVLSALLLGTGLGLVSPKNELSESTEEAHHV